MLSKREWRWQQGRKWLLYEHCLLLYFHKTFPLHSPFLPYLCLNLCLTGLFIRTFPPGSNDEFWNLFILVVSNLFYYINIKQKDLYSNFVVCIFLMLLACLSLPSYLTILSKTHLALINTHFQQRKKIRQVIFIIANKYWVKFLNTF